MSSDEEFEFESDEEYAPVIVIDNGSLITKAGFSGDDAPRTVFETAIGSKIIDDKNKSYIGNELFQYKRDKELKLKYPLTNGICNDWDSLQQIWHHIFYDELKIAPQEHCIFLSEPPLHPKENREKCIQIMFETFNPPAMYLGITAVLSLYASGRTTGLIIDSGYNKTDIAVIYEGYLLPSETIILKGFGGKTITKYLKKLLFGDKRKYNDKMDIHFDDFQGMKEKFGYVSFDSIKEKEKQFHFCEDPKYIISGYLRNIDVKYTDYTCMEIENECWNYCQDEFKDIIKTGYKLPDGNIINVKHERYECMESFFDPSLVGMEHDAISKIIVDTNERIIDFRGSELLINIVLCGGNTLFDGLKERLQNEISQILPAYLRCKITAHPERKYSQWIGGSILGSLSSFQEMWITQQEFQEIGPNIVHRKCF